MGDSIGEMLPSAVGVAVSPLPIVAVVLMLVSKRARTNGPAFVVGWWAGVGTVSAIVLLVAGGVDASDDGDPAAWASILKLAVGFLLLLVSVRQWSARPREDEDPVTPKWMGALDGFSPLAATGAGLVLAAINPKNLLLVIAASVAIAETEIATAQQAIASGVLILISSVGVATPVVIYFVLGDRANDVLSPLKDWMSRNNAVIMAVLLLIMGVKLIGDGIGGLT